MKVVSSIVEKLRDFVRRDAGAPPMVGGGASDVAEAVEDLSTDPDFDHDAEVDYIEDLMEAGDVRPGLLKLAQDKYRLEKHDHKHRMGDLLEMAFAEYKRKKIGKPFFDWCDELDHAAVRSYLKDDKNFPDHLADEFASAFMQGVDYLNEQDAKDRYGVTVKGGRLRWGRKNRKLDTFSLKMSTAFSGQGWAIWVMDRDGNVYTNSHIKGRFHHSSFQSGHSVIAAGEWQVVRGEVAVVTGKTGHYRTGIPQLYTALQRMTGRMNFPLALNASVLVGDKAKGGALVRMRINPFLLLGRSYLDGKYSTQFNGVFSYDTPCFI